MSEVGNVKKYTVYTQRIGGNGTTYSQEFQCDDYDVENGILDFYNDKNEHWFLPIYKFDYIYIKNNQVEEE